MYCFVVRLIRLVLHFTISWPLYLLCTKDLFFRFNFSKHETRNIETWGRHEQILKFTSIMYVSYCCNKRLWYFYEKKMHQILYQMRILFCQIKIKTKTNQNRNPPQKKANFHGALNFLIFYFFQIFR